MIKFITPASAFAAAVAKISPAVPNSPLVPILSNIKLVLTDGLLTLTASNLEATLITTLQVEAKGDGALCVPAKALLSTLRGFPDQPITCSINDETYAFEMKGASSKYKLAGENANDFVQVPEVKADVREITLPTSVWRAGLQAGAACVTTDDIGCPAMTCALVEVRPDRVRFVGTDGFRVAYHETLQPDGLAAPAKYLLPARMVPLLAEALTGDEATLLFDGFNVRTADGSGVFRLLDENFPDYANVFPKVHTRTLVFDRDQMRGALRRLNGYTNKPAQGYGSATIAFDGSEAFTLTAYNDDTESEGNETMLGEYSGEAMTIGFAPYYLLSVLTLFPAGLVRMEMTEPNRAALFTSAEPGALTALVMPTMISPV